MPKTLNIAVIGSGTMAQAVHLPVLRRRWDRFAVTALVDHSARRRREASDVWGIEEKNRFETVADLIAAIRSKDVAVDGAVLSTDGLHVDDLLLLLKRGISVLVEPPLGYSPQEVARIVDFERVMGRRLVMMAYPQQYDTSLEGLSDFVRGRDLRMLEHEVLMPASQPLFGQAHVTSSAYDLPSEKRKERREALQQAVVAGSGDAATQRDRDLYVKGLLTGVAHQMAVVRKLYGPLQELKAVRHWPKGVIPGSIEVLSEVEGGGQVRLVDLQAPSHGDRRSRVSRREKEKGQVVETSTSGAAGSAESLWEAFHEFVDKGTAPITGAQEEAAQVDWLHQVLEAVVEADGRSLVPDPEPEADAGAEADTVAEAEPDDSADAAAPRLVVTSPPAADEPEDADEPADAESADAEPADTASAESSTTAVDAETRDEGAEVAFEDQEFEDQDQDQDQDQDEDEDIELTEVLPDLSEPAESASSTDPEADPSAEEPPTDTAGFDAWGTKDERKE
jgi:predicted dehydrogenase